MKSVGIVGLPGAGVSTIFTALTQSEGATTAKAAQAVVPVPDERVDTLADLHDSKKRTYTQLRFVEVSGRVRKGARGAGGSLPAELIGYLRESDALLLVLRAFDAGDPAQDLAELSLELVLADLELVAGKLDRTAKAARTAADADAKRMLPLYERIKAALDAGTAARELALSAQERRDLADLALVTLKPAVLVANAGEEGAPDKLPEGALAVAGRLETEVAGLSADEAAELLASYGQAGRGLERVIRAVYETLELQTFLTAGPTESRAWEIRRGSTAPEAAGAVHSDMERGFIRAEVCPYPDVVAQGGWAKAKAAGLVRQEGKAYVMREGDVVEFRFSV